MIISLPVIIPVKMTLLDKKEWKKGYPIKKAFMVLVWLLFFLLEIAMTVDYFTIVTDPEQLPAIIFWAIILLATIRPIKRYLQIPYHCMPYLYTVLSKEKINELLDEETNEIDMLKGYKISRKFRESKHWLVVNGVYVSKDLAIGCEFYGGGTSGANPGNDHLRVTYLTGKTVGVNIGTSIYKITGRDQFYQHIKKNTDIIALLNLRRKEKLHTIAKKQGWDDFTVEMLLENATEIKKSCRKEFTQTDMMHYNNIMDCC